MPAGEPVFGDGTLLEVNDGAAGAFVAVAELESLTPPGTSVKAVERKRLAATGLVERRPSPRKDSGECTFTYEETDVLKARLEGLIGVTGKSWRVTYADGLRIAWTGWLQESKASNVQAEEFTRGQGKIIPTSVLAITDQSP